MRDSTTRTIPLTQGRVAVVDAADFEMLSHWNWHSDAGRYPARTTHVKGTRSSQRMHRTIMLPGPGQEVDHINGDGLDNRRANLRLCTRTQNNGNQRKARGVSQYKGVYRNNRHQMWVAHIGVKGQRVYLGEYAREEDAARAYDDAARTTFGEFALTNFPGDPAVEAVE